MPFHADAGAYRIDILFAGRNGNLRAFAGFAGDALDLHGSVINFGNFRLEQDAEPVMDLFLKR